MPTGIRGRTAYLHCIKDGKNIDPPYNTGSDFIYRDDFTQSREEDEEEAGVFDEGGDRLFKNTEANGRFHSDWCSMIYPRLVLARNLLSNDGVIFIAIDDNEIENLKEICNEVFGSANFVATIVWKHTQQSKNDERHFSRQYNYNLFYAKDKSLLPNFYFERTDEDNKNYSNPDNDPKGMWRGGDVRKGTVKSSVKVLPAILPRIEQKSLSKIPSLIHNPGFGVNIDNDFSLKYDVFVSHASEDKDDVVRPLAYALKERNLRVWYDEFELKIGDSLRRKIYKGLANSRFGIVVISKDFINKGWANYELDGITRTI